MTESIKHYIAIVAEIKTANVLLGYYKQKREELQTRILGVKAVSFDKETTAPNAISRDKVIIYLDAYENKPCANNLSLKDNIEILEGDIAELEKSKLVIEETVKSLSGIEEQLFSEVAIYGKTMTEAVLKVSRVNYIAESTCWRFYVPKAREVLKMIREKR